ncbi:hypothetical protein [Umezawaea sp. NPDC059074]|uniref:hypothetical protein n=1 Tax=Umezawaea sp. NPDC059074 TaxID=3346716 RepID=UPI0036AA5B34
MSEFAATVRARIESARRSVREADSTGDEELAALHRADLLNLERIAGNHGIDVGGEREC